MYRVNPEGALHALANALQDELATMRPHGPRFHLAEIDVAYTAVAGENPAIPLQDVVEELVRRGFLVVEEEPEGQEEE